METLNIIIALIISISGYPIGKIISRLAKEEVVEGKDIFLKLRDILIILMMILPVYVLIKNIILSIFIMLIFIFIILISPKSKIKTLLGYMIITISIILSTRSSQAMILTCSLLFIYNLTISSIYYR